MAKQLILKLTKTYATEASVVKAVEKHYPAANEDGLRYLIMPTKDGRFYPIFVGNKAVECQVFRHFHVVN